VKGEKVTYFTAQWEFDSVQKMWNILYTEQEWKDAPSEKPHFENNTEAFKDDTKCQIFTVETKKMTVVL